MTIQTSYPTEAFILDVINIAEVRIKMFTIFFNKSCYQIVEFVVVENHRLTEQVLKRLLTVMKNYQNLKFWAPLVDLYVFVQFKVERKHSFQLQC